MSDIEDSRIAGTYVVSLDNAAATERARWGYTPHPNRTRDIPDDIQNAIKRALNANASRSDCTGDSEEQRSSGSRAQPGDGSVLALAARDRVVS